MTPTIFLQDVKISSAPFLLVRIPSLRIKTSGKLEVFEANLKTETELWNLMVKEMWAGRRMADQHKVQKRLMHTTFIMNSSKNQQEKYASANSAVSQVKYSARKKCG